MYIICDNEQWHIEFMYKCPLNENVTMNSGIGNGIVTINDGIKSSCTS